MAATKRAPCSQEVSVPHAQLKNYKEVHFMIKYWQSMHDYKYFLTESKVHFDSSERIRLHTELWKPWQKLRLFDTNKAMEFLLPFYSSTGRPAKNQPQILRSFILFFLLYSEGLAKPSLTLWVDRLKDDRVLASLIGCTTNLLPPLGVACLVTGIQGMQPGELQ